MTNSQDEQIRQTAMGKMKVVTVTSGRHSYNKHPALMNSLLNKLVNIGTDEIVVVSGHHGPLLRAVAGMLGDRLTAKDDPFIGRHKELDPWRRSPKILSMQALVGLGAEPDAPPPNRVLHTAMEITAQNKEILILDFIEVLAAHDKIKDALRGALADPQGKVVGIFQLPESGVSVEEALGLQSIQEANITDLLGGDVLRQWLLDQWIPEWQQTFDCEFASDAFDTLFELEAGACDARNHRVHQPDLAIEVAEATCQMVAESRVHPNEIKFAFVSALNEVNQLEQEHRQANVQLFDKIRDAKRLLERFKNDHERTNYLTTNSKGQLKIERAHVAAWFLSTNGEVKFRFPQTA